MKKIILYALALVLLFSSVPSAGAATTVVVEEELEQGTSIVVRELTREEAMQRLMETQSISRIEAMNVLGPIGVYGTGYQEAIITQDLGAGFKVEVGALLTTATGSGHSNFTEVITTWSAAAGSGAYTWTEYYDPIAEITGTTKNSVYLQVRGAIEVNVDITLSGSATFMDLLDKAEFELSLALGSTYTYRKVKTISGTYTMSGYASS